MKKVFIDCGSNVGQGLRQFINMFSINDDWEIHCYEPTPDLSLEKDLLNLPNVTLHKSAVWSKNGKIKFSLCIPNEKWEEASEGSSVLGLFDLEECIDPNSFAYRLNDTVVDVESIDINDILKKYSKDDYIVVKLDIEGSEFEVCRRLLEGDEIFKINEFFVEWHTRLMSSESKESENNIKNSIRKCGVNLHDWH